MNVKAKHLFCVVAYDVQNDRNRSRIAKLLAQYGVRINRSVFECMFTHRQIASVHNKIAKMIDPHEDMVAYYTICVDCFTKIVYQPEKRNLSRESKTIQVV
jgi:CRISPR-associated protein Cas2